MFSYIVWSELICRREVPGYERIFTRWHVGLVIIVELMQPEKQLSSVFSPGHADAAITAIRPFKGLDHDCEGQQC